MNPGIRVDVRDAALAKVVTHAAGAVDGVVRLQGAVSVARDTDSTLDVAVRLVTGLRPTPLEVIDAVAASVHEHLRTAGERGARVEVTVVDVEP